MNAPSIGGTRLFPLTIAVALLSFVLLAQSAMACEAPVAKDDEAALDVRDPLFAEKLAARYLAGMKRPVVTTGGAVGPR